jgi:hypothetical protein
MYKKMSTNLSRPKGPGTISLALSRILEVAVSRDGIFRPPARDDGVFLATTVCLLANMSRKNRRLVRDALGLSRMCEGCRIVATLRRKERAKSTSDEPTGVHTEKAELLTRILTTAELLRRYTAAARELAFLKSTVSAAMRKTVREIRRENRSPYTPGLDIANLSTVEIDERTDRDLAAELDETQELALLLRIFAGDSAVAPVPTVSTFREGAEGRFDGESGRWTLVSPRSKRQFVARRMEETDRALYEDMRTAQIACRNEISPAVAEAMRAFELHISVEAVEADEADENGRSVDRSLDWKKDSQTASALAALVAHAGPALY